MSPRAGFAVSPRAGFAVNPWGGFPVAPAAPPQPAPAGLLAGLPEPLRKALVEELLRAQPQRATDIYYEDDGRVFVMRSGVQYVLTPPASLVWTRLGPAPVSRILDEVANELGKPDPQELRSFIAEFLLAANEAGLIVLYPAVAAKDNLTPGGPRSSKKS